MTKHQLSANAREDGFSALCDALGVRADVGAWQDEFGAAMRRVTGSTALPRPRVLSLFAGAGGLDIGFEDAGFDIVAQLEVDRRFARTLLHHQEGGATTVLAMDIRDFKPQDHGVVDIDFMIGGPPCQSFSAAGRRASGVAGLNDDRGRLFREYIRLLKELMPRGFLFENVAGLIGANQGKAWQSVRRAFARAGYTVAHRVLDAADFGVPQHRERLFIVGMKDRRFAFPRPTHGPDSPGQRAYVSASAALSGLSEDRVPPAPLKGRYGGLLEQVPPGLNYSFFTEKMGHPQPLFAWRSKFSDFLYKADPEQPVRTIKAQGGQYTGPFHWAARPFSRRELKRLQTIPDDYELVGGRQVFIQQVGNSVPPQLARILALCARAQLFEMPLPGEVCLPMLGLREKLGFRQRKRASTARYRALASAAHAGRSAPQRRRRPTAETRIVHLTSRLGWKVLTPDQQIQADSAFSVDVFPDGEKWLFEVHPVSEEPIEANATVTLRPREGWALSVPRVELRFSSALDLAFTAAWKAFDDALFRNGVKADLVQLCGYYQYEPRIVAQLQLQPPPKSARQAKFWRVLERVVAGVGTRATIPVAKLAALWKIDEREVMTVCARLRKMGYEIRNRATNSEIPPAHILVPYPFPTLRPESVQLRKSLVSEAGR